MDGYGLQSEELVKIQKGLQSIEDVAAKERIRATALQAQSTQLALSRMDYERKLKDQLSIERVKRKELREKLNSCSDSLQQAVSKTSGLSSALDYALQQQHVAFDTITAKDAELCAMMDKNRLLEREMYQTQRNLDTAKDQVETFKLRASKADTQLSAAKEMLQIKSSALSNAMKENRMLKKEVDELKTCTKEASAIHEDNCVLQQQLDETKLELSKARKQVVVLSNQLEETNRLARNSIEKAQRKESERWELRKQLDHAKEDIKELRSRLPRSAGLETRCTRCSKWDGPCGHRIDIFPVFDRTVGFAYPNCETNWCQQRAAFVRALKSELHDLRGAFRVLKDGEGRRAESALRRFENRLTNIISSVGSSRSCRHDMR